MKYIVYKTTNLVNGKIYVGVHGTENPDVFDGYLGNGLSLQDLYFYRHPKEAFHYAVAKYGILNFERTTIQVFDTKEEAFALEAQIVNKEFINRPDTYNSALGGGRPPGYSKVIYQYTLDGKFIKEWENVMQASRVYHCKSSIGRAVLEKTPSHGFLWSDKKCDILDLSEFKINKNKIRVYMYDNNGNYLQEFISISECARYISVIPSAIHKCLKSESLYHGQWYFSKIRYNHFIRTWNMRDLQNCKLYQYDLDGNFIREWENATAAKEILGTTPIHHVIKYGETAKNFQWSYEKVPKMNKVVHKSGRAVKVGRYSMNGELLETFNTMTEAINKYGRGVANCIYKKQKTTKGFKFKYLE